MTRAEKFIVQTVLDAAPSLPPAPRADVLDALSSYSKDPEISEQCAETARALREAETAQELLKLKVAKE